MLGPIGTPVAMVVLFFAGLPWLTGIGWRQFAAWVDTSFGVKLARDVSDDEARGIADLPRSALHRDDDIVQPTTAHTVNSMAPRQNGRYSRPTLWKPDPQARPKPRSSTPARPHVEPVAPSGWLKPATPQRSMPTPPAPITPASAMPPPTTGSTASLARAAANSQVPRPDPAPLPAGFEPVRPRPTGARPATAALKPTPPRTTVTPRPATAQPQRPPVRPAAAAGSAGLTQDAARRRPPQPTPARAPLYAWTEKPAAPITPAPSVHDTLRSIEASTAQWATLGGAQDDAGHAAAAAATAAGVAATAAGMAAPAAAAVPTGLPPRPTASRRMTPVHRSPTIRRRHTTTTHRSCSMRSIRQRPLSMHRLPIRAPWQSTPPHRTRCRIPASLMPRSRITPMTRSGTPTMSLPLSHRHRESRPHRRSTRPSTSRRGRTSPANRFPRSTHPPGTRSPSHRPM